MGCDFGRLDRDRRRAGEAALGEHGGGQPGQGADPRAVMQHRRGGDLAHHLAARAVIFGNAERLAQLPVAEPSQACRHGGHAERIPCARRMIVRHGRMQCDAGPAGDFVADGQGRQCLRSAKVGTRLGKRRQRRHHHHADMALGRAVSVMTVEIVDLRRCCIGRARDADAAAVEKHARRMLWVARAVEQGSGVTGDPARFHRAGRNRNSDRVQQQVARLIQHCARENRSRAPQHEVGQANGSFGTRVRPFAPMGRHCHLLHSLCRHDIINLGSSCIHAISLAALAKNIYVSSLACD